jgi:hypothetical protein
MFKSYPNRSLTLLRLIPTPMIDFVPRLSKAATAVAPVLDTENWSWQGGNNTVFLRDPARRQVLVLAFNAVQFQTLGLDPWTERLNENIELLRLALSEMGVRDLKRADFRCKTYLDLKMTHPEIVDAAFGSIFAQRTELSDVSPNITDLVVRLFGMEGQAKFDLLLAPQTAEEFKNDYWGWPNLDGFNEAKSRASNKHEFYANLNPDRASLTVECEVSREKISSEEALKFLRGAADQVDKIATRAVNKYRSMPIIPPERR